MVINVESSCRAAKIQDNDENLLRECRGEEGWVLVSRVPQLSLTPYQKQGLGNLTGYMVYAF